MDGNIKFRVSAVDDFSKTMNKFDRDMNGALGRVSKSTGAVSDSTLEMAKNMRDAYKDMKAKMDVFKVEQMAIRYQFMKLGQSTDEYAGKTKDFMSEIEKLGKKQKQVTDNMLKNNEMYKISLMQQAGTLMNASTHAEKLQGIYEKTNPALGKLTSGTLKAQKALQKFANSGSAAQIALEALGPTANAKDLTDFTKNLNQSLGQVPILAIGAAAAFGLLTYAISKAAIGPKVSEVKQQISQLTQTYKDALNERKNELNNFVGLFEKVSIPKIKGSDLQKALDSQTRALKVWMSGLKDLAKRGVDEGLIAELQKLGPKAAGEIHGLTHMSDSELNKYVSTWREKHALINSQAISELSKLKEKTKQKVQELKDSLTPLGIAAENFKSTWASALKPFIELWGQVYAKIVDVGTAVGAFFVKLNSINPIFSQIIFSVLYLTTLFLLLAIPIALVGKAMLGIRAIAFMFLKPLAALGSLLAAATPIALLMAAAVVGVGVALYLLYTKTTWFKGAISAVWEAIKTAWTTAINFIKNVAMQVMNELSSFFGSELAKIRSFWDKNGKDIMRVVTVMMALISGYIRTQMAIIQAIFSVAWSVIKSVTSGAWSMLKGVISGAIQVILGIIKTFVSVLQGDWRGAWEGVKQITKGAIQVLASIVKGTAQIGANIVNGLISGINSAAGRLMDTARSIAKRVTDTIKGALNINSPSRVMMELGEFTGIGLAEGMRNTLGAITKQSMGMANATVAPIKRSASNASSVTKTTNNSPVNITLNYSGSATREDVLTMADLLDTELAKRFRSEARLSGVKL